MNLLKHLLRWTSAALCCAASLTQAQPFSFVAMGDMPYGPRASTQAPYERLIDAINRTGLPFAIHIGDIKSGSSRCDDEEFVFQKGNFQRFEKALVYTPGDNEWTDCHRGNNGSYDPVERLVQLRKVFFTDEKSLGQTPLTLQSQPKLQAAYPDWVENRRWQNQGIAFATVHIVGSNNNRDPKRPSAMAEFEARDKANVAWIEALFTWAKDTKAKAVVLAMQADPLVESNARHAFPADSGFLRSVGQVLIPLAHQSGLPVLLVHGDSHTYTFDRPFKLNDQTLNNLYRLQVPGGVGDYRAVKVTVDPVKSNQVFSVEVIAP
jgi:hypothetical protein